MNMIINAVKTAVSSICVDMELSKLEKELRRKGLFMHSPKSIHYGTGQMEPLEGYRIAKNGHERTVAVGYDSKVCTGITHRADIRAMLLRNGYAVHKVYIAPNRRGRETTIKFFNVMPRTLGE